MLGVLVKVALIPPVSERATLTRMQGKWSSWNASKACLGKTSVSSTCTQLQLLLVLHGFATVNTKYNVCKHEIMPVLLWKRMRLVACPHPSRPPPFPKAPLVLAQATVSLGQELRSHNTAQHTRFCFSDAPTNPTGLPCLPCAFSNILPYSVKRQSHVPKGDCISLT